MRDESKVAVKNHEPSILSEDQLVVLSSAFSAEMRQSDDLVDPITLMSAVDLSSYSK